MGMHLTKETSYPSEWYSAFSENPDCYVVLHLSGERRLYGWPEEWPSRPDEGHFRIAEGEWLTKDGQRPMKGVSAFVVPARDVEMIEFLQLLPPEDASQTKPWQKNQHLRQVGSTETRGRSPKPADRSEAAAATATAEEEKLV